MTMNLPVAHKKITSQIPAYREAVKLAFSAPKLKEIGMDAERIQRIAHELGAEQLAVEFSLICSEVREKVAKLMPAVAQKSTGRGKKTPPSDGGVYTNKQIEHFRELYNPGPKQKFKLTAGEIEQTRIACRRDGQIFTDSLLRDQLNIKRGRIGGHRGHGHSGNIEVYTPPQIIERVKRVFNQIDFDPCSCLEAQKIVGARYITTALEDGLKVPWWGKVFLNPPYYPGLLDKFIAKLHEPGIEKAIVLLNNNTETRWAQDLFKIANMVCFPRGRLTFWKNSKESYGKGALQGQMIIGIRVHQPTFSKVFSDIGFCSPIGWEIKK